MSSNLICSKNDVYLLQYYFVLKPVLQSNQFSKIQDLYQFKKLTFIKERLSKIENTTLFKEI